MGKGKRTGSVTDFRMPVTKGTPSLGYGKVVLYPRIYNTTHALMSITNM